ncbi:MAG: cytochrome c3 family protein [Desulfobulbaceae bacterium]|nr:cytochrome c3 family protein [Desulfobulbaceae bacterium]
MGDNHNTHVKWVVGFLTMAAILGLIVKKVLVPEGFGTYGHYRAGAILDEFNRETRHMTNDSCLSCHPFIKEMHLEGIHRTVSCEFCHGPYGDHIRNGKKVATLPVKKGEEITALCLRCHNQIIRARPKESIKMITMPDHLENKKVQTDHNCDQCHNVHAPLMYVKQAREMMHMSSREDK